MSLATAERLVRTSNAVVVLPAYRLSTQAPYPAAPDCYDALLWLRDHASDLGIADDQLVVGGESAGGGLTAAVTLAAPDRGGVAVAFQEPLYPMIDDRGTASSRDLYLGHLRGGDVPAYAAPARAADLAGLPPTLPFVGDIEPFHDEVVDWCQRLQSAGVGQSRDLPRRLPRLPRHRQERTDQPRGPGLLHRRIPRLPRPPSRSAARVALTGPEAAAKRRVRSSRAATPDRANAVHVRRTWAARSGGTGWPASIGASAQFPLNRNGSSMQWQAPSRFPGGDQSNR
jgi:hypothetical protein